MAEDNVALIWFTVLVTWTVILMPLSVWLNRYMHKYFWDVKKIWSIKLNSNTGLGEVKLVKATEDGFKAGNGCKVDTEMNFGFKDQGPLTAGCPIFAWDGDTALLLRPMSGETEMSDPAVNEARNIGSAIDSIKAMSGVNWNFIIVALLVAALLGLGILGFMVGGTGQ